MIKHSASIYPRRPPLHLPKEAAKAAEGRRPPERRVLALPGRGSGAPVAARRDKHFLSASPPFHRAAPRSCGRALPASVSAGDLQENTLQKRAAQSAVPVRSRSDGARQKWPMGAMFHAGGSGRGPAAGGGGTRRPPHAPAAFTGGTAHASEGTGRRVRLDCKAGTEGDTQPLPGTSAFL